MGLLDFLDGDARQRRADRMNKMDRRIDSVLDYYLGPTGIPEKIGQINQLFNPIIGMRDAGAAAQAGDYGTAALETAGAAAPLLGYGLAAKAGKMPISQFAPTAASETLAGVGVAAPNAGALVVPQRADDIVPPTFYEPGVPITQTRADREAMQPQRQTPILDQIVDEFDYENVWGAPDDIVLPDFEPETPGGLQIDPEQLPPHLRPQDTAFAEPPTPFDTLLPPEAPTDQLPAVAGGQSTRPGIRMQDVQTPPAPKTDIDPATLRYSPTRRALDEMTYKGGDPSRNHNWAKMRKQLIQNGAKDEEIKWLGLDEHFSNFPTVSKEQVQGYLANRPDITEVRRASTAENRANRPEPTYTHNAGAVQDLSPDLSQATTWQDRYDEIYDYYRNQYIGRGDPDGPTDIEEARQRFIEDTANRDDYIQSERDYYTTERVPEQVAEDDDFLAIEDAEDDDIASMIAGTSEDFSVELDDGSLVNIRDLDYDDIISVEDPRQMHLPLGVPNRGPSVRPGMEAVIDAYRDNYSGSFYDMNQNFRRGRDTEDRIFDPTDYSTADELYDYYGMEDWANESWNDYADQVDDQTIMDWAGVTEDDFIDNYYARHPDDNIDEETIYQSMRDEGYEDDDLDSPYPFNQPEPTGNDMVATDLDPEARAAGALSDPNTIEGTAVELPSLQPIPPRSELYPPSQSPAYQSYFTPGSRDYMTNEIVPGGGLEVGGQPGGHNVIEQRQRLRKEPVVHFRSGIFETAQGDSVYHVGEVQSDWAQGARKIDAQIAERKKQLQMPEGSTLRTRERILDDLRRLEIAKKYIKPGPFQDTTQWSDTALRQGIADAVLNDADFVSLGTGQMASDMTYATKGAANEFYNKTLRTRFEKLARQIFGPDAKVQMIEMQGNKTHKVPAIKLTSEMKDRVRRFGIPLASIGGAGLLGTLEQEQQQEAPALLGGNI